MRIEKAAVLGAGTMGAQIAAHLANAGVPTLLLDIPPRELTPEEQAKGLSLENAQVKNRMSRNGLEAAMGALAEASIPATKRWIPKGMEVSYLAKATGDITCIAETDRAQWTGDDPDVPVRVRGVDRDGTVVVEGEIRLWVTDRR